MGNIPSEPSKPKPSPPDEIVELKAPKSYGFSGTVKYYRHEHAETIHLLREMGYVEVGKGGRA